MALSRIADMFNVEVFADAVQSKLGDAIRLYNLAYVQSFEGQQAGSITLPKYAYIGDAVALAEGVAIDPALLTRGSETLDVIKMAQAVNLTAEAINGSFGNPVQEAENQLVRSIANGIEREMFARLATDTTLVYTSEDATIDSSDVLNALALFGEDQEGAKSFVVNPATLPTVRQDVNFADNQLFDLDVVVSNRVPVGSAYIIKPEGLGLYMSKETEVLIDEDVLKLLNCYFCLFFICYTCS